VEKWTSKKIPTKAVHVLRISAEGGDRLPRKSSAIPWNSPKGSFPKAKLRTTNGIKADPSQVRLVHRSSHYLATKGSSIGSRSPPTSRAVRVRGETLPCSTKSFTTGTNTTMPEIRVPFIPETKDPSVPHGSDAESSLRSDGNEDRMKDVHTKEMAAKVKAKRSFRDFFHIRDSKSTENVPKLAGNKRSSLTVTGNTLAKRFRHSATLAKPNPSLGSTSEIPGTESAVRARMHGEHNQLRAHSDVACKAPPATCSDTGVIVNKIVKSVSSLPNHSPDRLRGLEIAEVCKTLHVRTDMLRELVLTVQIKQTLLNTVDAYKQARISATKAGKHARQAKLNAERAGVELERMQKLCEPDFDHETIEAIKILVKCVGAIECDEQSS
jgi:hypothetical protein